MNNLKPLQISLRSRSADLIEFLLIMIPSRAIFERINHPVDYLYIHQLYMIRYIAYFLIDHIYFFYLSHLNL